jgi:hypothetical protein
VAYLTRRSDGKGASFTQVSRLRKKFEEGEVESVF